jgi:hypothetical protein
LAIAFAKALATKVITITVAVATLVVPIASCTIRPALTFGVLAAGAIVTVAGAAVVIPVARLAVTFAKTLTTKVIAIAISVAALVVPFTAGSIRPATGFHFAGEKPGGHWGSRFSHGKGSGYY